MYMIQFNNQQLNLSTKFIQQGIRTALAHE